MTPLGAIALILGLLCFAGDASALSYVALGDSLAVGSGDGGGGGYVARYRDDLATDLEAPVVLQNLGVGGSTSQDLLDSLTSDSTVRSAVAGADVVTLDCLAPVVRACTRIRERCAPARAKGACAPRTQTAFRSERPSAGPREASRSAATRAPERGETEDCA